MIIWDVFVQVGRGVCAAHNAGIVHRDLKPQNVLVDDQGHVKVLDFGLAVDQDVSTGQVEANDPEPTGNRLQSLTATGALVGTPVYMSPEQYRGQPATAASDQYSYCVSLYQCLYGSLPFSTTNLATLSYDILEGRIATPEKTSAPGWLLKCLRRGMAKDPADRYPSMDVLTSLLDRRRSTRKVWWGAAVAATLAGTFGFAVASSQPQVEVCPDASAELAGLWDAETQQGIATTLNELDTQGEVFQDLEKYVQAWIQQRNEACLAHAEGRLGDGLFSLRTACLDQRRAGLQTVLEVIQQADASTLRNIPQSVAALPTLSPCADSEALLSDVSPPEDPALRARVQHHREQFARANALKYAGKPHAAVELLDVVAADTTAMKYLPLVAELEVHRGLLLFGEAKVQAAKSAYEKSLYSALRAGHLKVAAQASSRLGYLLVNEFRELEHVEASLPLIEALNAHVEGDVDLYAEHLNNLGYIKWQLGERQEATRLFESADALRRKHDRAHTPLALGTLANLGYLAENGGHHQRALRYLAQLKARSKTRGPWIDARVNSDIASQHTHLGQPEKARQQLLQSLNEAERTEDPSSKLYVLYHLSNCEFHDGNFGRAKRLLEQAQVLLPKESRYYIIVPRLLMRLAALTGDTNAVERHFEDAWDLLTLRPDSDGRRRTNLMLHYSIALTDLGRPVEAIAELEKVRNSLKKTTDAIEPALKPRLSLALGQAYRAAGQLAAAEATLEQALMEFGDGWPIERANTYYELGLTALDKQQREHAARQLDTAQSLYTATAEKNYLRLARTRFALASQTNLPKKRAIQAAKLALEAFHAKGKHNEADEIKEWLAQAQSKMSVTSKL